MMMDAKKTFFFKDPLEADREMRKRGGPLLTLIGIVLIVAWLINHLR